MTPAPPSHLLPTLLGFAFVAAWIGFGLGSAVLCLLGALAFRVAAGLLTGELELEDLRERAEAVRSPRGSRVR